MWWWNSSTGKDAGDHSRDNGEDDEGQLLWERDPTASPTLALLSKARERTKRLQAGIGNPSARTLSNTPGTPKAMTLKRAGVTNPGVQQDTMTSPRLAEGLTKGQVGIGAATVSSSKRTLQKSSFSRLVSDMILALVEARTIQQCLIKYFEGLERDDLASATATVSRDLLHRANVNNVFSAQLGSVLLYLLTAEKLYMSMAFLKDSAKKKTMIEMFQKAISGVRHLVDASIVANSERQIGGRSNRVMSHGQPPSVGEDSHHSTNSFYKRGLNQHQQQQQHQQSSAGLNRSSSEVRAVGKPRYSVATEGSDADMFNFAFASIRNENSGLPPFEEQESLGIIDEIPDLSHSLRNRSFADLDNDFEDDDDDQAYLVQTVSSLTAQERELVKNPQNKAVLEEYATVFSKMVQLLKLRLWTVEAYSKLTSANSTDSLDSIRIPEIIQLGFEELAGSSGYTMLQKTVDHAFAEFSTVTMLAYARYNISSYHLQGSMLTLQRAQERIEFLESVLRETQGCSDIIIPGGTAGENQNKGAEANKSKVGGNKVGPFRMTIGMGKPGKSSNLVEKLSDTKIATEAAAEGGEISQRFLSLFFARRAFNVLAAKSTLFFYPCLGQRFEKLVPQDEATRRKKRLVSMIRQFLSKQSPRVKLPGSGGTKKGLTLSPTSSTSSTSSGNSVNQNAASSGTNFDTGSNSYDSTENDVAFLLILDANQCLKFGPPIENGSLSIPQNSSDQRFTSKGGNQRAPLGQLQQPWQLQEENAVTSADRTNFILPTDSPNGYVCPDLVGLFQTDSDLKLRFRIAREISQKLIASSSENCETDGTISKSDLNTLEHQSGDEETEMEYVSDDLFRETAGIVSWPVVCKFPWDFHEQLHMPNLVSLIMDDYFDCVSAPYFDIEKQATYVVYKIDPTMHLALVYPRNTQPNNSMKKEIVAFCSAIKDEITPS